MTGHRSDRLASYRPRLTHFGGISLGLLSLSEDALEWVRRLLYRKASMRSNPYNGWAIESIEQLGTPYGGLAAAQIQELCSQRRVGVRVDWEEMDRRQP